MIKFVLVYLLTLLISCNTKHNGAHSPAMAKDSFSNEVKVESSNTSLIETFIDSSHIADKGNCKLELTKRWINDEYLITIKFYIKSNNDWLLVSTYSYESNTGIGLQPVISDFNNDGYNDLTFISAMAARGANEVRRLFIYDALQPRLISIVNAQDFPNLQYNKTLDCIDAFIVHGTATTEFARIEGDSLKRFAGVDNDIDHHTVYQIDNSGGYKLLYKVPSTGLDIRFKNYNPLIPYTYE